MIKAIPVFRVFDYAKTIEFYVNWLGATIVWEHKPENTPFYMQILLHGATLNLSQHHGDCSPGALLMLENCTDLKTYHQELLAKEYPFMKPGLEKVAWDPNTISTTVIDPFFNRIIFTQKIG